MGALIRRRLFVIIPGVAVITMLAGGISIGDVNVSRDAALRATPPRVVRAELFARLLGSRRTTMH